MRHTPRTVEAALARAGVTAVVDHAQQWAGSRDYALRCGLNPGKVWACSILDAASGCWIEPDHTYRTLGKLLDAHLWAARSMTDASPTTSGGLSR